jgi:SAM-dependent methyltransferase
MPDRPDVLTYVYFQDIYGSYLPRVIELARELNATAVAELGGGALTVLGDEADWGFVPNRVVYDIDPGELEKASGRVDKREADLCKPLDRDAGRYDLVFSQMLCEHLLDPEMFHRNCFHLLRPGGVSVHFFPTLGAAPFVLNRVIPETLGQRVIRLVQPGRLDDPNAGKFPAYYRWCTGPTPRLMRRFEALGFQIQEWRVGFGHCYYERLRPLQTLEDAKARALIRHPVRRLSSYGMTVLRKPG